MNHIRIEWVSFLFIHSKRPARKFKTYVQAWLQKQIAIEGMVADTIQHVDYPFTADAVSPSTM